MREGRNSGWGIVLISLRYPVRIFSEKDLRWWVDGLEGDRFISNGYEC